MAFVYTYGGVTDYTDGYSTNGWQPHNFTHGGRITFTGAGTIDQLSAWCRTSSGTPGIKYALYDTSGNLISGTSSTGTVSSGTASWVDSGTFSSVSVSATDYFILTSSETEWTEYGYDTANDGSFATEGYSTFPADPETISAEADTAIGYGRRANFTASGAAASSHIALLGVG